ncbi:hypothetical protein YC2023_025253 [Brassica napus]
MQWGALQCVMQWGASMYYAVGSRRTHYIMVHPVFAQPSEEQHTVTVQRFRRTSQIRRWRSYPSKPQRCARTRHDRRWSSKCYSRGQNGVHDVMNGHVSSEAETERLVFNHGMSKCSELRGHLRKQIRKLICESVSPIDTCPTWCESINSNAPLLIYKGYVNPLDVHVRSLTKPSEWKKRERLTNWRKNSIRKQETSNQQFCSNQNSNILLDSSFSSLAQNRATKAGLSLKGRGTGGPNLSVCLFYS